MQSGPPRHGVRDLLTPFQRIGDKLTHIFFHESEAAFCI